jgi:hypothetical protein
VTDQPANENCFTPEQLKFLRNEIAKGVASAIHTHQCALNALLDVIAEHGSDLRTEVMKKLASIAKTYVGPDGAQLQSPELIACMKALLESLVRHEMIEKSGINRPRPKPRPFLIPDPTSET